VILRSIRPTRQFLLWLGVLLLAAFAGETLLLFGVLSAAMVDVVHAVLGGAASLSLMLALLDLPYALPAPPLQVTREVDGTVAVERLTTVSLTLRHLHKPAWYRPALQLVCHDHHPQPATCEELPIAVTLPAGRRVVLQYRLKLLSRGDARFTGVDLQHRGGLGVWDAIHFQPLVSAVRIFPDFSRMDYRGLLTEDYWSRQIGIRKRQRRGEGMDFHQLREYRVGDTQRQIDWKATALRRQLIAREYQEERDQHVMLLLDAGQSMRVQEGELTHFDHALNSMVLLAHIALKTGDSVGFMSIGSETERYFSGRKGVDALNSLLNAVYDLRPENRASDYLVAATRLMQRNPRRSLVILLTNLGDSVPDELMAAVNLMRQRHVLLIANLREQVLADVLQAPVDDFNSSVSYAFATDLDLRRRQLAAALQQSGVRVFDSTPAELATLLVNRYFDIKLAGVL
jgi:uncharacterized protein (DUF58 family)